LTVLDGNGNGDDPRSSKHLGRHRDDGFGIRVRIGLGDAPHSIASPRAIL